MSATVVITGNEAAASAAELARVQVIAAYPITPQSPVVERSWVGLTWERLRDDADLVLIAASLRAVADAESGVADRATDWMRLHPLAEGGAS